MTRYIDYGRMSIKNLEISEKVQKSLIKRAKDSFSELSSYGLLGDLIFHTS
jgi:hypothetical protein